MKYDGIAVGPLDLSAGLDFLKTPPLDALPWISANIYGKDGSLLFTPYVSIEKAGVKIGIIALTDVPQSQHDDMVITSGVKELNSLLPALAADHDFIILLSTLPHKKLLSIPATYPGINVILSADGSKGNIRGLVQDNVLLAQTSRQGKYLGILDIVWTGKPWDDNSQKKLKTLKHRYESVTQQLIRSAGVQQKESPEQLRKTGYLEVKQTELQTEISVLENKISNTASTDLLSTFSSTLIPLSASVPEDNEVKKLIFSSQK